MTDTHNINIETKPQLDEIHKQLKDLKAAERGGGRRKLFLVVNLDDGLAEAVVRSGEDAEYKFHQCATHSQHSDYKHKF